MYALAEWFKIKRNKAKVNEAALMEQMERQKYNFLKIIFDHNKTLGRHYHTE